MAIRAKLTTLDELEARRTGGGTPAAAGTAKREVSEEEKATRKERVAKAKDALARSVGMKGDHVASARAALKRYLQQLNDPRQPDDAAFEALIEAPFQTPQKKKPGRR